MQLQTIDAAPIEKANNLRIVARLGVGCDAVDVAALTAGGSPLTVMPVANAASVALHAQMLTTARQTLGYHVRTRAAQWGFDLHTFDVAGRTVLAIGSGRIGGRVAQLRAAFGVTVLVRDPCVPRNTITGAGFTPADDLDTALAVADIVTLHVPSNSETRGLATEASLKTVKPGVVLVNTARRTLVDAPALAPALASGHVAAAGLDLFAVEPVEPGHVLLKAPDVVVLPHRAAATAESMRHMAMSCTGSILASFEHPPSWRVKLNAQDATWWPAHRHTIGMVFPRTTLFPHMTVRDKVAFPPKVRGVLERERGVQADQALAVVRLAGYGGRRPNQLSGGQRVALACAIVYRPRILLMDAQLQALDKALREEMQPENRRLQRTLGTTVASVTHDRTEALPMADRIAVLDHGRLMQLGTSQALSGNPENPVVAGLRGRRGDSRQDNHGGVRVERSDRLAVLWRDAKPAGSLTHSGRVERRRGRLRRCRDRHRSIRQ